MSKDMYDYLIEFEENGFIYPECPTCQEEGNPLEIDADSFYCETCQEQKKIEPII